jgi:hypothetical protein
MLAVAHGELSLFALPGGGCLASEWGYFLKCAFSADGAFLVVGGTGVSAWRMPSRTSIFSSAATSFALGPDGRTLAYGTADGQLHLLDLHEANQPERCLADPGLAVRGTKVRTLRQRSGSTCVCDTIMTATERPLTSGVTCVCDTVSFGTAPKPREAPGGGGGGGHYWRPN